MRRGGASSKAGRCRLKEAQKMKNLKTRAMAALVLASAAPFALMAEPAGTYDAITDAVDFADVLAGVVAIAALVAAVLVGIRGVRWILAAVKR